MTRRAARRPHPAGRRTTSTCSRWPARDGVLLERARRRAGRPGRRRCGSPSPTPPTALAADRRSTTRSACPGTGAVAFGALPFRPDPTAAARRARGGVGPGRRRHAVGHHDRPAGEPRARPRRALHARPRRRRRRPGAASRSRPVRSADWWCDLVAQATKAMREAGPDGLRKVVLAREVLVEADQPVRPGRACSAGSGRATPAASCSTSTGSSAPAPSCSSSGIGDVVRAQPMAGTAPRGGDPDADARLGRRPAGLAHLPPRAPDHDRHGLRHAPAVVLLPRLRGRAVGRRRGQRAAPRHAGRGPAVAAARRRSSSWWRALHPTPAVSGWPRDAAPRSGSPSTRASTAAATPARSAGSTPRGNGTWAVSIRCAEVDGHHGPGLRRQRHRGRHRPRHRAGRDPGQARTPCSRRARSAVLSRPGYCDRGTRTRRSTSVVGSASVGEPTSTPTRSPGRTSAVGDGRLDGVPHDLVGGAVGVHHDRPDAPGHRQLPGRARRRGHGEDRAGGAEPADHAGGAARVGAGDDGGQLGVDRGPPGRRGDGRGDAHRGGRVVQARPSAARRGGCPRPR